MSTPSFPRAPLFGAAAVILLSLTLATGARIIGTPDSTPVSSAVQSRDLLFRDQTDGGVAVFDVRDVQDPVEIIAPGTNGFLRAAMRGLARQRLRAGDGADTPFRLTEWADGRLTLEDPATGRKLEMAAFGISNEEVFARLLTAKGPSS